MASIPQNDYVEIQYGDRPVDPLASAIRVIERRLDQHIGQGGSQHASATEQMAGFMSAVDKQKMEGIQAGATRNSPDDFLLNRGNHTGLQAIETVEGLRQQLDDALAGGSNFRGLFPSLAALQQEIPVAAPGNYADVDEGQDINAVRYIWDDSDQAWVSGGEGEPLTAPQVRALLLSNPNTNIVTDTEKSFTSRGAAASPKSYGALGDGVADDTAAIQACLDASLVVDFGSRSDSYKVSGKLMLRSGHNLRGGWPTITQTAIQTPLFDCIGKDLVSANGLRLVGVRESTYVNSPTSQAIAFAADSATRLSVFGNIFKDFCYSPLMVGQTGEDITFAFNVVDGPGAGILSDPNFRNTTGFTILGKNVTVHGNKIKATASGGIIGQLSENVVVSDNIIHDIITEHGLYCDTGIFGLVINGNTIRNTVASGLKVQNYDAVGGNSGAVSITGNTVSGVTAGDGIQIINTGPTATPVRCKGLTITGNVVSNVGQDGISHRYTDDAVIAGNSVSFTGRAGIYEQNHLRSVVKDNSIYRTQAQGIEDILGTGNVISDNRLEDIGRLGGAVIGSGIHIAGGSEKDIYGNLIIGNPTLMEYGIFIEDGTQSTMSVWGNRVSGTKSAPMRFKNPAEPLRYFADNQIDSEPLFLYNVVQRGNKGQEFFGTSIPTSGSYRQGDRIIHSFPSAGGFTGWVCVQAGSPGAWRTYGAISS